jgi:hypothetical protein
MVTMLSLVHEFLMVFEWFQQFKDEHKDFQDDSESTLPSTFQNAGTTANVNEMVI